jgi:hypothetical protein
MISRFNMVNKPVTSAVPDAVTTAATSFRALLSVVLKHHLLDYLILCKYNRFINPNRLAHSELNT